MIRSCQARIDAAGLGFEGSRMFEAIGDLGLGLGFQFAGGFGCNHRKLEMQHRQPWPEDPECPKSGSPFGRSSASA